jgi:2TM domain-containing protein
VVAMTGTPDAREAARKRIEERRGFVPHLVVYLLVNGALITVWATMGPHGFFWPAFVLLFWGIGIVMHGWNAFFAKPITEADVDREVRRGKRVDDRHDTD